VQLFSNFTVSVNCFKGGFVFNNTVFLNGVSYNGTFVSCKDVFIARQHAMRAAHNIVLPIMFLWPIPVL